MAKQDGKRKERRSITSSWGIALDWTESVQLSSGERINEERKNGKKKRIWGNIAGGAGGLGMGDGGREQGGAVKTERE